MKIPKRIYSKLLHTKDNGDRLKRNFSPLRGSFSEFYRFNSKKNPNGSDIKTLEGYNMILGKLFDYINTNVDSEIKESISIGEKYQSEQKGPTAPIVYNQDREVIQPLIQKSMRPISPDDERILEEAASFLIHYFGHSIKREKVNLASLDFSVYGKQLPNQTLRGLPYLQKGIEVDEDIIQNYGKDFHTALKKFSELDSIECVPGGRIQGSHGMEKAKLRVILIPPVGYQYINVAIYKSTQELLKDLNNFAGWQNPSTRMNTIISTLTRAKMNGRTMLALDYSKFDQSIHPKLRKLANKISLSLTKMTDTDFTAYTQQFDKLMDNQKLLYNLGQGVASYSIPYQLLSGIINTQQDGSIINLLYQLFIMRKLNIDWDIDGCLALGDDTGILIPNSVLNEYGYSGLLEKIDSILSRLGAKSHTKKAYPTPQFNFLQKLWDIDLNILGQGSGSRSIASFIWKERYSKRVPGIKSLPALELLAQVSIISNALVSQGNLQMNSFSSVFVEEWLKIDDGLMGVVNYLKNKGSLSPNSLIEMLIKLSGVGFDDLLDFLDLKAYDHSGLTQMLETENRDFSLVFPITKYIVQSSYTRVVPDVKALKLFKDLPDPVESNEFILDE